MRETDGDPSVYASFLLGPMFKTNTHSSKNYVKYRITIKKKQKITNLNLLISISIQDSIHIVTESK